MKKCITRDMIRQIRSVRSQLNELKKKDKELTDTVKAIATENGETSHYWDGSTIGYSIATTHGSKFDTNRFKKDYPALYAAYVVQTETVKLNIK